MKLFHRTPEGCAYRKGVNWHKAPGWFRTVFFCGDCRLYFRVRWKLRTEFTEDDDYNAKDKFRWAPRVFLRWDLRKNEEGPADYVLGPDGVDMVPATRETEEAAVRRLIEDTRGPYDRK